MEQNRKIRVAITQGDTNGVGYELILKTFSAPEMLELCTPIVYGSPKIATYHRKALNMEEGNFTIINNAADAKEGRLNLMTCFDNEVKVELGTPTKESVESGIRALSSALADASKDVYDVLVLLPLQKDDALRFPGQQTFVDKALGTQSQQVVMNGCLRVAFMTSDIALKDVAARISQEGIKEQATRLFNTLRRDFRILNPRVAVLALNPTADGQEEKDVIAPAIAALEETPVKAFGPYAAEQFFGTAQFDAFDGILAMYHDQGILPLTSLLSSNDFPLISLYSLYSSNSSDSLNSLIVTSLEDNPLFEQAGKGVADEQPLRQAIYTAIDAWRNRHDYDEPYANPLPKLYHEKRDESEKVRFAIPKKHENSIKERL